MPSYMPSFSDAIKVNFQLGIWVSQFIFGDLQMLNGRLLRKDYSYL
jgi:hypothetical protein